MLKNLQTDVEHIGMLKASNTDIIFGMYMELDDLKNEERAFVGTVMQAAKANPQNTSLQIKFLNIFMDLPNPCQQLGESIAEFIMFLYEIMDMHIDNGALQSLCCRAAERVARSFPESAEQMCQQGGITKLLTTMSKHGGDAAVAEASSAALLVLTRNIVDSNSEAVFDIAFGTIKLFMHSHRAQADVQRTGNELLDVLTQTAKSPVA
jgi:hypothetical protein